VATVARLFPKQVSLRNPARVAQLQGVLSDVCSALRACADILPDLITWGPAQVIGLTTNAADGPLSPDFHTAVPAAKAEAQAHWKL